MTDAKKSMMLDISGVDHSFDESRDTHCIILYGEFIMSEVNYPPHAVDLVTGHEEKIKRAVRSARRHIAVLAGR